MPSDQLQVHKHGKTSVVRLGSEYANLDEVLLAEAERSLLACAEDPDTQNLVVDLSHTEFFGTSFLESLFRAWNRMRRKGGGFALAGLLSQPAEVIRISKLDLLWTVFATTDEALHELSGQPPANSPETS